jgi:hypothetical protein
LRLGDGGALRVDGGRAGVGGGEAARDAHAWLQRVILPTEGLGPSRVGNGVRGLRRFAEAGATDWRSGHSQSLRSGVGWRRGGECEGRIQGVVVGVVAGLCW